MPAFDEAREAGCDAEQRAARTCLYTACFAHLKTLYFCRTLVRTFQRMTRIEFDTLRLRYEAAFDAYQLHAARIIAHSKGGERPPDLELHAEEQALWELAKVRRELLDALCRIPRYTN